MFDFEGLGGALTGAVVGAAGGATAAARWDWRLAPVGFVGGGFVGMMAGLSVATWFNSRWYRR